MAKLRLTVPGLYLAPAAVMTVVTSQDSYTYDVAVIGGGPAGLSAALWLARYLHSVVVVDSGDPSNWETRGIIKDRNPKKIAASGIDAALFVSQEDPASRLYKEDGRLCSC